MRGHVVRAQRARQLGVAVDEKLEDQREADDDRVVTAHSRDHAFELVFELDDFDTVSAYPQGGGEVTKAEIAGAQRIR